ncbi:MAG: DUF554 domain-containing protein [Synechococcales bacterium]|nr:DUF554 domain-containing protein [Synechococcales bacterium]
MAFLLPSFLLSDLRSLSLLPELSVFLPDEWVSSQCLPAQVAPVLLSLSIWDKTSGTWINVATIWGGTVIGLLLRGNLPPGMQWVITQGLGLFTLFLGTTMAHQLLKLQTGRVDGVILGLLAMVLGGLLGEWWQVEVKLTELGERLKQWVKGGGRFTEGFVVASLLFGIGPMAIVGCLNNGLSGNNSLLTVKSVMDGLASIPFSSTYGVGVGFSSLSILLYQGSLSLAAGLLSQVLPDPANHPATQLISGVGGLIVIGIGCNLLEIAQIRVASFLPAILLAPLLVAIVAGLG